MTGDDFLKALLMRAAVLMTGSYLWGPRCSAQLLYAETLRFECTGAARLPDTLSFEIT